MRLRLLSAFLVLAMLAGCRAPVVEGTGRLAIRSVAVVTDPSVTRRDFAPKLQAAVSEGLMGGDTAGRPARMTILIDDLTYKNPALTLVLASANSLTTTVTIADEGGATIRSFHLGVVQDALARGVTGAAGALVQDRDAVDRAMIAAYARQIRDRIYGPEGPALGGPPVLGPPAPPPLPQMPASARGREAGPAAP
ncbi:hypothetical protein [Aurantimonas sp. Leaf443]|uniref:hypothetical protein n=1 Tax=Aurantimonas sp. Leaf443 TaxID=1736378 RepID=UPI0006FC350F|nr:hypothetical protein [Aurantimonas sp. Leaf443]KQT83103.1 hypothetical protein ASG48_14100 [Aurantimonas sp. Leaf443]